MDTGRYPLLSVAITLIVQAAAQPVSEQRPAHSRIAPESRGGGGYCAPGYTVGPTDGDFIQSVMLGDIVNTTGDNLGVAYTDYANSGFGTTTRVLVGNVYQLTVTSGSYDPPGGAFEGFGVWVDYDQNNIFDPDENITSWTTVDPYQVYVTSFSIAANALPGYTGMRVRNVYGLASPDPCATYGYGECEDYMILIEDGTACIPLIPWGNNDGDEITNVSLGAVDLTYTLSAEYPWLNGLWTGRQMDMGETYDLDITIGSFAPEYIGAWIDWNGDTDFNDVGETIGLVEMAGAYQTATFFVTPPYERFGYFRMRIRSAYNAPGMTACSDVAYGETEDYTVSVRAPNMPCLPILGSGGTYGSGITSFDLFGVPFTGDNSQNWPYYSFHSFDALRALQGDFYLGSLVTGAYYGDRFELVLDVNGDGDMDDAGEMLWTADNSSAYETLPVSFTIPVSCPPGQHILRLRAYDWSWSPPTTCDNFYVGEIEDMVLTVEANGGYCLPYVGSWTIDGDFIEGFQVNTIANTPTGGLFGPAYSDYSAMSTDLVRGDASTAYVIAGSYWPDAYAIYIDYDQNGVLDEATESLGVQSSTSSYEWLTFPFTVPATAMLGPTLLRVRCAYGALGVGPCDDTGFGETEDYTVNITTTTGADGSAADALQVWPEAGAGMIHVLGIGAAGAPYELFDATGRVVREGRSTGDRSSIGMHGVADGAYTLRIVVDSQTVARRFSWAAH